MNTPQDPRKVTDAQLDTWTGTEPTQLLVPVPTARRTAGRPDAVRRRNIRREALRLAATVAQTTGESMDDVLDEVVRLRRSKEDRVAQLLGVLCVAMVCATVTIVAVLVN